MKKRISIISILVVVIILLSISGGAIFAAPGGVKGKPEATTTEPTGELPPAEQKLTAPPHNLSTPAIITDDVSLFYEKVWVDADSDGVLDGNEFFLNYDPEGNLIPILVDPDINDVYTGDYVPQVDPPTWEEPSIYQTYVVAEVEGEWVTVDLVNNDSWVWDDAAMTTGHWEILLPDGKPDLTDPVLMEYWLPDNAPWYPQAWSFTDAALSIVPLVDDPATLLDNLIWNTEYLLSQPENDFYANAWQAQWQRAEELVYIDFVDWGNPLENTNPLVGYRFPIELYLYTKLEEPMLAYNMACLEAPHSADELYGTDGTTFDSYYATVLTSKFRCEVWDIKGGSITPVDLEPAIGPSGKMNFASAGGGWIPKTAGPHRIYFYLEDPLISLQGAIVNNDEHYIFDIGLKAEDISTNKQDVSYVVGGAQYTWIDVEVLSPNSNGGRKKK